MKIAWILCSLIASLALPVNGAPPGRTEPRRETTRRPVDARTQEKITHLAEELLKREKGLEIDRAEALALAEAAQSIKAFEALVKTLLEKSEQNKEVSTGLAREGARIAEKLNQIDIGNIATLKDLLPVANAMAMTARGEITGKDAKTVLDLTREVADNLNNNMAPNEAVAKASTLSDAKKRDEFLAKCK